MTDAELLEHIEESQFWVLPRLPGSVTWFDDDGLRGRQAPIDNATANGVLTTRLRAERVDDAVVRARERFAGTRYGWVTTSRTTPRHLGRRLVSHGYHVHVEAAGMVLRQLDAPGPAPRGVRVRRATSDDLILAARTNAAAYGISMDVSTLILRCHLQGAATNSRVYLAYPEDSETPAGVAIMVALPGTRLVLMASAATVAAFRGQGLYTALIHQRLADARALGADMAIVHALTHTSAPICQRRGYQELERLQMYVP